jgi:mono/diheme cytochrome c family protein/glucose/arabinose dehydrogenase
MKRNQKMLLGVACISAALFYTCKVGQKYPAPFPVERDATGKILVNTHPDPNPKSPEDEMRSIYMPKGYHLQLVASEPMVSQPVAIAWDGDARMYVAELNTYMLDVNGTGEHDPTCRIKLLEDTNGDGVMDKVTIFADNLILPRTLQPLDHGRLLVNLTWTNDVFCFQDTDGDGVSDKKTVVYKSNTVNTNNLEHQKSGLIWNLDNRMYVTYDPVRFTLSGENVLAEALPEGTAPQWGLGNDDYGRLFFSSAGSEDPALDFQQNPHYGRLDFRDRYDKDFVAVWPIVVTPDVQGGLNRLRPDSTLNHFTASNGQSIFRGDKLPADMKGDLFICEPVGRLIRRAKVTNTNGKLVLTNAYDKQEFLASTDLHFRPVNTVTGPDGCLYIVDMYHGIIQESEWTKADSYLRPKIKQKGLDKNIGRGRIFRLVHDDFKPTKERPRMLEETSAQLVAHLTNPNGWWRDNAQKLLVIRNDKSVVPALKSMALTSTNHLARIHALWTLNGMGSLDNETFAAGLKDADARVRKTVAWIGEDMMKVDTKAFDQLAALKNDPDADVRYQLLLTMRFVNTDKSKALIADLIKSYPSDPVLAYSQTTYENKVIARAEQAARQKLLNEASAKLVSQGALIYKQLCFTCHGSDAKGVITGGTAATAPALAGNPDVNAQNPQKLIRILLHGLQGPIRGTNYTDVMPALGSNDDKYIASVLSYIRSDFGNKGSVVLEEDVARVRAATLSRTSSYTIAELDTIRPIMRRNR